MSAPQANARVLTMKGFRLRLSSLIWLIEIAAEFLAGIRDGGYWASSRPRYQVYLPIDRPKRQASAIVLSRRRNGT